MGPNVCTNNARRQRAAEVTLLIGTVLSDRYELAEQLGKGAMAVTYAARDRLLDRMVAVKVLRPAYVTDEEFCARFQQEAQAAANLAHPHITAVHDIGRDGDVLYMVMELVRGRNLKEVLETEGPLAPDRAVSIARQVAEALQVAHAAGIIHRDIKPQNILLTSDDRVKVCDFGIAKALAAESATQTRTLVGTAHYLSPEQALGKPCVPASDLYSLGVVLFEMLTGKLPFTGDTPVAVAVKHAHEPPPNPRTLRPDLPAGLERIVLRALSKEVAARYQTAQDFLTDLSAGSTTQTTTAPAASTWQEQTLVQPPPAADRTTVRPYDRPRVAPPPPHRERVNPWVLVLTALLAVAVAAGSVIYGLSRAKPHLTVPDVVGLSQAEAKAKLEGSQLRLGGVTTRTVEGVPTGQVLEQDPAAGTDVEPFSLVNLVVSQTPQVEIVEVPDVTDMSLGRASELLTDAGLQQGDILEEPSETVPAKYVIRQAPRPGTKVERDTPIDLFVSSGPPTPEEGTETTPAPPEEQPGETPSREPRQPSEPTPAQPNPPKPKPAASPTPAPETPSTPAPAPQPSPAEEAVPVQGQVTFTVPPGADTQNVRIVLHDAMGDLVVYEKDHAPGDTVSELVSGKGKDAKASVYLDGKLVQEVQLKPK